MIEPLRWGILGAANIAEAIARAIAASPGNTLQAVASRDIEKARRFAKEHGARAAVEGYAELLARDDVDAVYIPLPNSLHAEWTLAAIDAGKPVLCEKPFALNADQARAVAAEAERAGVPVMEAFGYRFHPMYDTIGRLINEGAIGKVVTISSVFNWRLDDPAAIPASAELGGGALMDVGCYGVHVARMLTGEEPLRVLAFARRGAVDETLMGVLEFPGGVLAHVECSMETEESRHLEIKGARGSIIVDNPWYPREIEVPIRLRRDEREEIMTVPGADAYRVEIEEMERAIRTGTPPCVSLDDAVANMRVLDALAASSRSGSPVPVGRNCDSGVCS